MIAPLGPLRRSAVPQTNYCRPQRYGFALLHRHIDVVRQASKDARAEIMGLFPCTSERRVEQVIVKILAWLSQQLSMTFDDASRIRACVVARANDHFGGADVFEPDDEMTSTDILLDTAFGARYEEDE